MPHYRFTFLTALVIVLGYGLALFWPNDDAYVWGWRAMICLPLLLAIFMWSAVRGAAPLDDRAFHRTLPPGDGVAFRKVLEVVALVPAGIALVVLAYCWKSGFGWRAQTLGLAMLTVPVIGAVSVLGLTASLATSRSYSRIWPWLWTFGVPVFSACGVSMLTEGLDPELRRTVYFTHWRTIAVAGAVLYPLIWWLIAARRRIVWGVALATVLGILMPWLYHYGDLGPDLDKGLDGRVRLAAGDEVKPPRVTQVHFIRKPMPSLDRWKDKGIDLGDLIQIEGMEPGEFMLYGYIRIGVVTDDHKRVYPRNWEIVEDEAGERRWRPAMLAAGANDEGVETFGRNVVWSALSKRLPDKYPVRYWKDGIGSSQGLERPPRTVILRPGAGLSAEEQIPYSPKYEPPPVNAIPEDRLKNQPWFMTAAVYRFDYPMMSVPVSRGGSMKFPRAGLVEISSLKDEGQHSVITVDLTTEDLWQADGPWPGLERPQSVMDNPWCFLVDREQGQTYIIDGLGWGSERQVMLGSRKRWIFDAGSPDSPEMKRRLERLPHCELHLFWPRFIEGFEDSLGEETK
ncbi:MAG: hypothetical protein JWO82_2290 [Akkermansiaceae bacterium]|nr:hypothetical protein [Akkermansiaceae bacterium]